VSVSPFPTSLNNGSVSRLPRQRIHTQQGKRFATRWFLCVPCRILYVLRGKQTINSSQSLLLIFCYSPVGLADAWIPLRHSHGARGGRRNPIQKFGWWRIFGLRNVTSPFDTRRSLLLLILESVLHGENFFLRN
jgi:hypothetical protein